MTGGSMDHGVITGNQLLITMGHGVVKGKQLLVTMGHRVVTGKQLLITGCKIWFLQDNKITFTFTSILLSSKAMPNWIYVKRPHARRF